jgi:hypothetical protein
MAKTTQETKCFFCEKSFKEGVSTLQVSRKLKTKFHSSGRRFHVDCYLAMHQELDRQAALRQFQKKLKTF